MSNVCVSIVPHVLRILCSCQCFNLATPKHHLFLCQESSLSDHLDDGGQQEWPAGSPISLPHAEMSVKEE